jgi:hypothetical protein
MVERAQTLKERVKSSDTFLRINELERKMENFTLRSKEAVKKNEIRKLKGKTHKLENSSTNEANQPLGLFNVYTVNSNKNFSKYFLYDDLIFPRMVNSLNLRPHSIDDYWMSGFLDRQKRDNEAICKKQAADDVKRLTRYTTGFKAKNLKK